MWSKDKDEGIAKLTPFGAHRDQVINYNKALKLALEPECAALATCRRMVSRVPYSDQCGDNIEDKSYLVVDIGGGTVDVTALMHADDKNCYEVVTCAWGRKRGGMNVNDKFMEFLAREIVKDPNYDKFLSKNHEENQGSLIAIRSTFEKLKIRFCDNATYPISEENENNFQLLLDHKFVKFYGKRFIKKNIQQANDGVALHKDCYTLIIYFSKMAKLFKEVLEDIAQCAEDAIKELDTKSIGAVCITGGFGGCRYVFSYLKATIYKLFAGNEMHVPFWVALDHTVAVSHGAVHYGRNPEIITARTADATYGTIIYIALQEEKQEQEDRNEPEGFYTNSQNQKWCRNMFLPLVKQGDRVKASNYYPVELSPVEPEQDGTTITFCRTTRCIDVPCKITDLKENLEIIASIDVPVGRDRNGKKDLLIEMNFSSTEIIAYVHAPGNTPKIYLTTMDYMY